MDRNNPEFRNGYIEGLSKAVDLIRKFAENYPEDVFPPDSTSPDSAAAKMARHLCMKALPNVLFEEKFK